MAKKGLTGILYQMLNEAILVMSKAIGGNGLAKSFTASVEVKGAFEYDAVIETTKDYYDYQDKGVKGSPLYKGPDRKIKNNRQSPYTYRDKKPPISALSQWSKSRGISPYAVSYGIWRDGIPAKGFIAKGLKEIQTESNMQDLADAIAVQAAYANDLAYSSEL